MTFYRFSSVYIPVKPKTIAKVGLEAKAGVWANAKVSIEVKVGVQKKKSIKMRILLLSIETFLALQQVQNLAIRLVRLTSNIIIFILLNKLANPLNLEFLKLELA